MKEAQVPEAELSPCGSYYAIETRYNEVRPHRHTRLHALLLASTPTTYVSQPRLGFSGQTGAVRVSLSPCLK